MSSALRLADMPDDLLIRVLKDVPIYNRRAAQAMEAGMQHREAASTGLPVLQPCPGLSCRLASVPLVSRRMARLCAAPELVRSAHLVLGSEMDGSAALARLTGLHRWLAARARGAHMRLLWIGDSGSEWGTLLPAYVRAVRACLAACPALLELQLDQGRARAFAASPDWASLHTLTRLDLRMGPHLGGASEALPLAGPMHLLGCLRELQLTSMDGRVTLAPSLRLPTSLTRLHVWQPVQETASPMPHQVHWG